MTFDMDQPYETAKGIALSDTLFDQMPDPDNPDGWYEVINYDRLIAAIADELRKARATGAAEMREQCRRVADRRAKHGSYDASEIAERIAALPLVAAG